MAKKLTHLDRSGAMRMVDVTRKKQTTRTAVAEGFLTASEAVISAVQDQAVSKGDVFAAARLAGIQAIKRTDELVPLCHPLSITHASIELEVTATKQIRAECTVTARDTTGVEMEALTGVSVACLTLYDMTKSMDKSMEIGPIRLLSKKGGKSGRWKRK